MYHVDTLPPSAPETALRTHRAVFINETLSRMSQYYGGAGAIRPVPLVELQQIMTQAKTATTQGAGR